MLGGTLENGCSHLSLAWIISSHFIAHDSPFLVNYPYYPKINYRKETSKKNFSINMT